MAQGTDNTPPYYNELDGGCGEEKVGPVEDEDPESSSLAKAGKPPRNLSVMRHSMSQATLVGTTDLVSEFHFYDVGTYCVPNYYYVLVFGI